MIDVILKKALEEATKEKESKKIRVGRISIELRDKMKRLRLEHDAEHDRIEALINAFVEKLQKEHSCDEHHLKMNEAWEEVYDELNLSQEERGFNYSIKRDTGIVFREIEKSEDEEAADAFIKTFFQ